MDFFIPLFNTMALAGLLLALIVGLVLAPWQVLLLVLIAGLLGIERLKRLPSSTSYTSDPPNDTSGSLSTSLTSSLPQDGPSKSQDVVFVYRGSTYKVPSIADNDEPVEISGKYRGQVWKQSTSK
jgi:hypothetical protein